MAAASLFTFLYFRRGTPKLIYLQREARWFVHLPQMPAQRLALSLPLSLSQDETANATVTVSAIFLPPSNLPLIPLSSSSPLVPLQASAVRVLGVFVLYDCLREVLSPFCLCL